MLIIGTGGQLGTAFRASEPGATYWGRSDLNLTRPEDVYSALARARPDAVINCAAYTAVDEAESDEPTAHLVNADSVGEMARYASDSAISFITYSSDYVFDGAGDRPYLESDPTGPINAYGRSKRAGEKLALGVYPEALVIRTSWLISATHPSFVAKIIRSAREHPVRVVDDQFGCPTVAADLVRGTLQAVKRGARGVLHLTNLGSTTWYELAFASLQLARIDPKMVSPCSTEEYSRPALRPLYSVLGSERHRELGLKPMPSWRASLPSVVENLVSLGLA